MAAVLRRRVIDFHSGAVNGGEMRRELGLGSGVTEPVPDNKQHRPLRQDEGEQGVRLGLTRGSLQTSCYL